MQVLEAPDTSKYMLSYMKSQGNSMSEVSTLTIEQTEEGATEARTTVTPHSKVDGSSSPQGIAVGNVDGSSSPQKTAVGNVDGSNSPQGAVHGNLDGSNSPQRADMCSYGHILNSITIPRQDGGFWKLVAFRNSHVGQLSERQKARLRQGGFDIGAEPIEQNQALAAHGAPREPRTAAGLSQAEQEKVKRQLYLLHAATGHGSRTALINTLKRRRVRPEVLELAHKFRCSVCEEKGRIQPRQLASLETLPPKWHTVAADLGHWCHPVSREQVQ